MISTSLLLLLIAHLLGDFYFQFKYIINKKKTKSFWFHALHASIYGFFIYFASFFFAEYWLAPIIAVSIAISHFAIDYCKSVLMPKVENTTKRITIFVVDQTLHISILIGISILLKDFNDIGISSFIDGYPNLNFPFTYNIALLYLFSLLFLFYPGSVLNKFVLDEVFGKEKMVEEEADKESKAGFIIGILERWTMYIFSAFLAWHSIIPVVLTAKTFARFKRFENDAFTEKYIVGTLLSTLYVGMCLVLKLLVA